MTIIDVKPVGGKQILKSSGMSFHTCVGGGIGCTNPTGAVVLYLVYWYVGQQATKILRLFLSLSKWNWHIVCYMSW